MIPDEEIDRFHQLYKMRGQQEAVELMNIMKQDREYGPRVLAAYRQRIQNLRANDNTLARPDPLDHLILPGLEDLYWPAFRDFLSNERNWPDEVVESIDRTSADIMMHVGNPAPEEFDRRGLVVGYVQSGKTANYMAVLSRAADAGYRIFIVLAGMFDSLRNQTQCRLEDEIFDRTPHWIKMTGRDTDFNAGASNNLASSILQNEKQRVVCVIKKNTHILSQLINWLEASGENVLNRAPTLIIDDEADQASLNTNSREQRSAINRHITNLLGLLPRSTYVAYTATPFANVLVEPSDTDDLYPRDFIKSIEEPIDYFGARRVFGRLPLTEEEREQDLGGLDVVRYIPETDITSLKAPSRDQRDDFEPQLTPVLKEALCYFLLGCAARMVRGQQDSHMTMLIHTSVYVTMHEKVADIVTQWLDSFDPLEQSALLEHLWRTECERVEASTLGETPVNLDELLVYLPDIIESAGVITENGQSKRRLDYENEARIQIAVGGNSLSRGLTLEGLSVSYFLRRSMQYDTLLQMGRWFGYRRGYSDLMRIYTTAELAEDFEHLATVEEEIRRDISLYRRDEIVPTEFGVRVRTHPQLAITSPSKMANARACNISFSGRTVQTTRFSYKNNDWLTNNLQASKDLLRSLKSDGLLPSKIWDRHLLYRDVDVDHILEFLRTYDIHGDHAQISNHLLREYIQAQLETGALTRWNVAVIGRLRHNSGELEALVPDQTVGLLNRSKLLKTSTEDTANLGVITSQSDFVVDLMDELQELRQIDSTQRAEHIRLLRNPQDHANRRPLMLIYPINKDSPGRGEYRANLEAHEHIIGLAISFPEARHQTAQRYVRANIEGAR